MEIPVPGNDCESLSETAAQNVGYDKKTKMPRVGTIRPDGHHRLLLQNK